jgi:hypothetical protein
MDTTIQPKQQTLDPRIMNNLFTATELFVNAIVAIIHEVQELIEDEEPFINRLNWKVLFDDFSKFKVVMTTWITSNTQRNVPTIVVEIDKIISYFNQLLVIIQTYERMPTRPELSKLNKTMVNNMTNYLSSISGAVNKLIDFNIDNVNDGFIDPENNGFGGDDDDWSFRPVDVIWQAFIDYEVNYASDSGAFTKLLQKHAKEGNSASNYFTGLKEDITNFWDRNIGNIWNAFTSSLGGLLNMFQLSMQQMGYGLTQLENFSQQANILNKAYNDSIYYSLGRPDTLLRAVDNPFTREYGEPVIEIREPFQRIHYLSSFSHIL